MCYPLDWGYPLLVHWLYLNLSQFSSILCGFPWLFPDFSSLVKIPWLFPDWKMPSHFSRFSSPSGNPEWTQVSPYDKNYCFHMVAFVLLWNAVQCLQFSVHVHNVSTTNEYELLRVDIKLTGTQSMQFRSEYYNA